MCINDALAECASGGNRLKCVSPIRLHQIAWTEFCMTMQVRMSKKQVRVPRMIARLRVALNEGIITACVFIACISGFGSLSLLHCCTYGGTQAREEKRALNCVPDPAKMKLANFPLAFERFYNDRLKARIDLISALSLLKYRAFGVSGASSVLVGKHGWMYFLEQDGLNVIRNRSVLTEEELASWAHSLQERQTWLNNRRIKFLFVIAPYKSSVYPEFVPAEFTQLHRESRADQLVAYLRRNTKVSVLDLRRDLIAAKPLAEVYFKTDTHWNRLGAFVGYRSIVAKLQEWFPQLKPLELADLRALPNFRHEGDLAILMGLGNRLSERYTEYVPARGFAWKLGAHPPPVQLNRPEDSLQPFASEVADASLPKAYILRDSFFCLPQPFISEHFRRAYFDWDLKYKFKPELIEEEHPDVFIQEMVENHLFDLPPNPPNCLLAHHL